LSLLQRSDKIALEAKAKVAASKKDDDNDDDKIYEKSCADALKPIEETLQNSFVSSRQLLTAR
jgi:hypothetical protein